MVLCGVLLSKNEIQVTTNTRKEKCNHLAGFEPRKLKTAAIAPVDHGDRHTDLAISRIVNFNNITSLTYLFLINLDF